MVQDMNMLVPEKYQPEQLLYKKVRLLLLTFLQLEQLLTLFVR
jgi:hypothetical protein